MHHQREADEKKHALALRCDAGLCEVVLEMFYASQRHDALAFGGAATEGFLGFVG